MADRAKSKGWSPYLAGALSGLVSILYVWTAGKYLGASTTFVKTTEMIERFFVPDRVFQPVFANSYGGSRISTS